MAYTTGTLTYIAGGPIEGAWKLWEYTTTDTLAQVTASGYITDASFKGMSLGDFVIVVNQTNPLGYILQVQNLTTGTMSVSGVATLATPWLLRPASALADTVGRYAPHATRWAERAVRTNPEAPANVGLYAIVRAITVSSGSRGPSAVSESGAGG